MKPLEQVLGLAPGLQAAARADASGNVVEVVGQLDAESLCAVVAMSRAQILKLTSLSSCAG